MPERVQQVINTFKPITLEGMDAVKLMTRKDTKYVCNIDDLPGILQEASANYQVLEINNKRLMGYESLYFETRDHEMYLKHHNRKRNRYKVRIRQYLNSGEFFLEIKFKKNTGETIKKRIPVEKDQDLHHPDLNKFLQDNSPYTPDDLVPQLFSRFYRMTLVSIPMVERITIDILPGWWFNNNQKELPYLVIMEVKGEKFTNTEGFGLILREARIQRKRISKYCTGINLLYPEIKYNRFKLKMLHLKKLDKSQHYAHIFESFAR